MGNMLYQSSDNKSIIKGDRTARSTNASVVTSLASTRDVTKNLAKGGGCGCGK